MNNLNKKGFTLIELLAVIVILGIILGFTIPSLIGIITNTRKAVFADTAKSYIDGARNQKVLINKVKHPIDPTTAVVISINTIDVEKGDKENSPFGIAWEKTDTTTKSYVVIRNVGTQVEPRFSYYFAATDKSGNCLTLTQENAINQDNIKSDFCGIAEVTAATTTINVDGKALNVIEKILK